MSDQVDHDPVEFASEEANRGFESADILAVLAVSSFLAAIGLATFFLTTAIAH